MKTYIIVIVVIAAILILLYKISANKGPNPGRGSYVRKLSNDELVVCVGTNQYMSNNMWHGVSSSHGLTDLPYDHRVVNVDSLKNVSAYISRTGTGKSASVHYMVNGESSKIAYEDDYIYDLRLVSTNVILAASRNGLILYDIARNERRDLTRQTCFRIAMANNGNYLIDTNDGYPLVYNINQDQISKWQDGILVSGDDTLGRTIPTMVKFINGVYYLSIGDVIYSSNTILGKWRVDNPGIKMVCRGITSLNGAVYFADDIGIHAMKDSKVVYRDNNTETRLISGIEDFQGRLCVSFYRNNDDIAFGMIMDGKLELIRGKCAQQGGADGARD